MAEEKFYLNNYSETDITINLSANRVIKGHTSLPLNTTDLKLYKDLVKARKANLGLLANLRLSTIPIEQDSRYIKPKTPEQLKAEAEAKAKVEAEEKARLEAEVKAKEEAERKAAEQAEKDAKIKAKIREELIKQANKNKTEFAEGELDALVEAKFAEIHK